jgi:hypothetical protein
LLQSFFTLVSKLIAVARLLIFYSPIGRAICTCILKGLVLERRTGLEYRQRD